MTAGIELPYQPFYCEENVYRLSDAAYLDGATKKVVFASNARRRIAIWHQKPAEDPLEASIWDYHAFLLARRDAGWEAWDPSSSLGAPVAADTYLQLTFASQPVPARLRARFRVVDADEFRATFSSDRSHMRKRGVYEKPPPPWPAVVRPETATNLARFVDMSRTFVGEVMDLPALRRHLSQASPAAGGEPR